MKSLCFGCILFIAVFNVHAELSDDWLNNDSLFDDDLETKQAQIISETTKLEQMDKEPSEISDSTEKPSEKLIEQNQVQPQDQSLPLPQPQAQPLSDNESNSVSTETNQPTSELEDVVITNEVDKTTMSEDTQKLFSMPGSAGDPLKGLEALPGITSEFSFVGAPSVRGSAPEDNSYLVDSLPVANLYHLLGYSIFSDNVVQNFDVQTGAFPAKYSGGTGAAIYVDLRQPKNESFSWTIDLGMFHSGFFVESKLSENQSLYFGARKSTVSYFAPIFLDAIESEEEKEKAEDEPAAPKINEFPNSDDVYFKYHNKLNDQHQVNVVVLAAQDYFGIEFPEDSEIEEKEPAIVGALALNSKQSTTGVNWIYELDANNRFNTSFGHLFLNSEVIIGDGLYNNLDVNSLIAKTNYESINDNQILTFGAQIQSDNAQYDTRLLINNCTRNEPDCSFSSGTILETGDNITINYLDSYAQHQWFFNDEITLTNGVHISFDDYIEQPIIQPRLKVEYNWYDEWIVNAAFGVHHQFPEITDLLPGFGNPDLKNITANHYVIGVEKNTYSGLKIKTDAYFKQLNNMVVSDEQTIYSNNGSGQAYGLEILLEQEKIGNLSGFVAISLSRSTRKNEVTGQQDLFELDKPFVMDWVLDYEPNDKWKIGSKWNLKSGNLDTPVIGARPRAQYPDTFEPIYGEFNSIRHPMSHQLDVRVEYKKKDPKKEITYYVDLQNLYNQKNLTGYTYNADYTEKEEQTSGFPFLPLFGMKMSF